MEALTWIALGVVVIVLIAWYLTYSAARLDRLHAKVEGALAALDAQLGRRAESALELGTSGLLDPASSLLLVDAASNSMEQMSGRDERVVDDPLRGRNFSGQESAESNLTDALAAALTPEAVAELRMCGGETADDLLTRLQAGSLRVQLARRFHNQAVTEVQRVRRKWVVRTFRLAGRAALPETVEFNDVVPTLP